MKGNEKVEVLAVCLKGIGAMAGIATIVKIGMGTIDAILNVGNTLEQSKN